ncbi:hypothetical protein AB1Y20_000912 [Prymnesium parvum]|uniref:Uncharacterized protein n=1 Tax=Prymnesium parvum TaxID=97485 RepID=A0AB34K6R1_PRYPA
MRYLLALLLLGRATGARLQLPGQLSRRQLSVVGVSALVAPWRASANTAPLLTEPMTGFSADEAKRAAFLEKQKKFKKAWRKELSNLEYAADDEEFVTGIQNIVKLIMANGKDLPEGARRQDLDQVYKRVQPKLGKNARMSFQQLDKLVLDITSVKTLKGFDEL